jgi:hypothetical protein
VKLKSQLVAIAVYGIFSKAWANRNVTKWNAEAVEILQWVLGIRLRNRGAREEE